MAYVIIVSLAFLFSPILSLPFVLHGLLFSRRYAIWFGFLFSIFIGLLLYHLVPTGSMDLFRYFELMDNLNTHQLGENLSGLWQKSDPLSYTIMLFVSHFFGNHAIPLTMAIVGYLIYFYIILDYSKILNIRIRYRAAVLIGFLSVYHIINTFTGVRFGLATSIFILAYYLDTIKSKRLLSILLYLLSPLIHSSMVTLMLIRIVQVVIARRKAHLFYVIALFIGLSSSLLLVFSNILKNIPFLDVLGVRAEYYLQPASPDGKWYPFNLVVSITMLIVLWAYSKKMIKNKSLLQFNIAIFIVAIANALNFYIASRYITIGKLLFVVCLVDIVRHQETYAFYKNHRLMSYFYFFAFFLLVTISFYAQWLAIQPLNFSGYNYFDMSNNLIRLIV